MRLSMLPYLEMEFQFNIKILYILNEIFEFFCFINYEVKTIEEKFKNLNIFIPKFKIFIFQKMILIIIEIL